TFVLAAALGHLQCEHGPIFAAHLMAYRGKEGGAEGERTGSRGAKVVRSLLRPWAKVAVFSADRAGLVAVRELPVALRAMERQAQEHVRWMPAWPALDTRCRALEDFDRSALMARRRVLADDANGWAIAPPGREEELDSLGHKLAAAVGGALGLGGRLAMRFEGHERRASGDEAGTSKAEAAEAEGSKDDAKHDDAQREAKGAKETAKADAPPEPAQPPLDPERASRLEQALRDAWSLARCDQRLTRRLGLL